MTHSIPRPYPGIRPFEEADWPIFFGREEQTNALLHKLETRRFVAVVGSSGSGKSSLVRAGLLPLVRRGFLMDVRDWKLLVMRPGTDPFTTLASQIVRQQRGVAAGAELSPADQVSASLIAADLRKSDNGLAPVLDRSKWTPDAHFLLVVDQFEELFGFRAESRTATATREDAERFVGMLLKSCEAPVPPPFVAKGLRLPQRIWVVTTMRSDFIGNCEVFPGLAEAVSNSQFLVPVLSAAQRGEAIVRPGNAPAIEGAAYAAFGFEDGLVNTIVNESGDRPDQLPLMQHALMRCWEKARERAATVQKAVELTLRDYESVGRIDKALHQHAETAWKGIRNDERRATIARALFLSLCDASSEGKLTRRRPKVSEVGALTGATTDEIEAIVRLFQEDDRNFLLPSLIRDPEHRLTSTDRLDISHEALLRQWRTYEGWQVEERGRVRELLRLRDLAELYHQRKEEPLAGMALKRANEWRRTATWGWASKYVGNREWDLIEDFIEQSRSMESAAQKRERDRIRWTRRITAAFALAALVVGVWADSLARTAADHRREAEAAKAAANVAERAAQIAKEKAKDAELEADRATKAAEEATSRAKEQQTLVFIRTITGSPRGDISREERIALWELAELPLAADPIREKLLEAWFADASSLERPFGGSGRGIAAAVGISLRRRKKAGELAAKLVARVAASNSYDRRSAGWKALLAWLPQDAVIATLARIVGDLGNPQETDPDRLSRSTSALCALVAKMDSAGIATLGERGATAVVKALENPDETDRDRLSILASALSALATKMDAMDAAAMAQRLGEALENPDETDSDRLSSLASALGALATKMDATDVAALAQRLGEALENPEETDPRRLSSLASALSALATTVDATHAATLAERVVKALENPEETDPRRLSSLASALNALAATVDATHAATLAERLVKALESPEETGRDRRSSLASVLSALLAKMSFAGAATLRERGAAAVVKAMENPEETDPRRLSSLAYALNALIAKMDSTEIVTLAERLVKALGDREETDPNRVSSLASALSSLVTKMDSTEIATLAERLVKALGSPEETDPDRLSILGSALSAIIAKMDSTGIATLGARGAAAVVKALGSPEALAPGHLSSLVSALSALVATMESTETITLAGRLVKALESPEETDRDRRSALASALSGLVAKLDSTEIAALAVRGAAAAVKALENPDETDRDRRSSLASALSALATKMDATDVAALAQRLRKALENPEETNSDRLSNLASVLSALATKMDATDVAALAQRLVKALENPKETNSDRLSNLASVLSAVATKMDATDVAALAQRLRKALENPEETDSDRLSNLASALGAFAAKGESEPPSTVEARGAAVVVKALQEAQETNSDRLPSLASALSALVAKMESEAASTLAARGATAVVKALENQRGTSSRRVSSLASALVALAAKMESDRAVALAARGAAVLVKLPKDLQTSYRYRPFLGFPSWLRRSAWWKRTMSKSRRALRLALTQLSARLPPSAQAVRSLGLARLLEAEDLGASGETDEFYRRFAADPGALEIARDACHGLPKQQLANVLKWPFCVGEAQRLVLRVLEEKTGRNFGGSVWRFAEMAPSLGIQDLDAPARRPTPQEALAELEQFAKAPSIIK